VAVEYRWAEGRRDRVPALAADLLRRQPAVINSLLPVLPEVAQKRADDLASWISAARRSADADAAQGFRLSTQPATGTAGSSGTRSICKDRIDGTINPFASVSQLFWVRGRDKIGKRPGSR
jgi:hypothetical protein